MSDKKTQNANGNSYDFRVIEIDKINVSKNIRDINEISDLAASIEAHGLINPITVSIDDEKEGTYKLVAGHRRFAAVKLNGKKEIPCNVITDKSAMLGEISLSENVSRMDMTPYEECLAVHSLINKKNTAKQVAKRFGRSLRWVLVREKLAKAGEKVLEKVKDGRIGITSAQKIADLPDSIFAREVDCCYRLDDWAVENILKSYHMDLKKAPFDTTACETCSKCSACQQDLFDDDNKKLCLDKDCWADKINELAQQKADKLNEEGTIAVVEEFSYGNDGYNHSIKSYEKKELAKAKDAGINERAVVNPETAKVTKYFDKRDLPDYHEETEEERDARFEQEEKEAERSDARKDLIIRKIKNQLKESIRNFGDSGILALYVITKPYNIICDEEAKKLEIDSLYGEIKTENVPDDCPVGKLAAIAKNSVNYIIDGYINNYDELKKIWNIFVRDENIEGRKSLEDLEPTEDEILAEIVIRDAEENDENNNDENDEIDEENVDED